MTNDDIQNRGGRDERVSWSAVAAGLVLALAFFLGTSLTASAETRTLKLYFLHTGERAEIAYKRNGRYLQSGLKKVNHVLRDWRQDEPTKMNPLLLDLLWSVYQETGARGYIHVVSAYRSPKTNAMLRKTSNGVAKKSQHMYGNAIDFFIPDVKLSKLRSVALKKQVGGVGYYPRSGSPFVHLDVGSVRHWPRMNRRDLLALFPDGKTLHVPSNGKPLPGYEQAVASYEARKSRGELVQVASDRGGGRGLLAALFGGGSDRSDREEGKRQRQVAAVSPQPAQSQPAQQERAEPATVLADLPPTELPVPALAPRPDAQAAADASEAPSDEMAEPEEIPAADEEAQDVAEGLLALNAPVPKPRPDYTAAKSAKAAMDARGEEQEPEIAPTTVAYVTPTPRPEKPASTDVIAELLSARKENAPEREEAPVSASRSLAKAGGLQTGVDFRPEATATLSDLKSAASGSPETDTPETPRVAFLSEGEGSAPKVTLSKGARTTRKQSRPGPDDQRAPGQPRVVQVRAPLADLVLSDRSVLQKTRKTGIPKYNAQMADSPEAVYTDGFQRDMAPADARRLTGSAVTFLAVAKFEDD